MPLREPYMVKQVYGTGDLSLQAKSGESLLVKDIHIYNPATNYATLKTEKTTVGYFRVGGNLGNHLPIPVGSASHSHSLAHNNTAVSTPATSQVVNAYGVAITTLGIQEADAAATTHADVVKMGSIPATSYETLLGYLGRAGIFKGYPVSEGETFQITGVGQAGALQKVIYEKHDAGDKKNTDENGSAALRYMFINYGRVSANITTTGDTQYDTPQSPAEFPDFPYGKTVPANTTITIHGVLASDIVDDRGGTDSMNSDYLKFIRERVVLFDDDRNGLFLKGLTGTTDTAAVIGRGLSLIGNKSDVDIKPPLMFPTPIAFGEGEELNVYITTTAGAGQSASDLLVADVEIGLIAVVERAK